MDGCTARGQVGEMVAGLLARAGRYAGADGTPAEVSIGYNSARMAVYFMTCHVVGTILYSVAYSTARPQRWPAALSSTRYTTSSAIIS